MSLPCRLFALPTRKADSRDNIGQRAIKFLRLKEISGGAERLAYLPGAGTLSAGYRTASWHGGGLYRFLECSMEAGKHPVLEGQYNLGMRRFVFQSKRLIHLASLVLGPGIGETNPCLMIINLYWRAFGIRDGFS